MKKKVIQIGGNLRINGISSFIMTLYRNLYQDFQFIFINTAQGGDYFRKEIEELGGKVYDVIVDGKGILRAYRQAKIIREIIRQEKPTAVHSHYYSNNGLYLRQAWLDGVPVRISHCHQSVIKNLPSGKRFAKFFSAKMVQRYATHSFACSDAARNFLYGKGGEVCFNAVDYTRFCSPTNDVYEEFGLDRQKRYCIFVGRFTEQKNIAFLLSICKTLSKNTNLHFLIIGHGPKGKDIEDFITENKLSNMTLLPPDSNVAHLLSVSSAFLLPSLHEGLPISLIEAQAVGVPCLVSDTVTSEVQMGLINYLPLKVELWANAISELVKKPFSLSPKTSKLFDDKCQAALFKGIYSGINADEWIKRGKEYSIGSTRFFRSKELAFASFKRAHLLGNARGTFYYALCYFEGNGISKDKTLSAQLVEKVVPLIERKAANNFAEYIVILADMYSFGLGKEQNFSKAFALYKKAAELGNLEAMCDLGYMYLVGQGVAIDKAQSSYWYKKSADLGYVHSMRDIGQNYLHGDGVDKDAENAVRYFAFASQNNYSHGTMDLAYCYLNGFGVQKDMAKVKELFRLALKQDAERTMRDLIALQVDIKALFSGGDIAFVHTHSLDRVDEQNLYNGCVCVSESIENVDPSCFYNADVSKFFVEKGNANYSSVAGVLFDKTKTTLVRFPITSPETRYVVPQGVTVIGRCAFQNARNLKEIVLPDTLLRIEESAFDDCKNLTIIDIPSSVTSLGAWAFHGCDKIKKFTLSQNLEHIGLYAFGSCESLQAIEVALNNDHFCSFGGDLYTKDMRVLLQYSIAKKQEMFILPAKTQEIAFRAVSDAYHLKKVDLKNVRLVGDKAFYYASSLERITFGQGTQFGKDVFGHTPANLVKEEQR